MRNSLTLALLLLALPAAAREQLPAGFVYLRDVAPSIAQDIRYATPNNFTAAPLPGYGAPECVLRREAAEALARVQADLARQHLSLKTYDCYRPERAVGAMWRWAHDGGRDGNKSFYPNTDKRKLFTLGYIAARSKHSTGTAIDLTLVPLDSAQPPSAHSRESGNPESQSDTAHGAPWSPLARGRAENESRDAPCTAPAAERASDNSLDMGTGFDCLDVKSYTRSAAITPDQRRARETLRAAMSAHGFRNYFREWWHYEFTGAPLHAYDVPIEGR
jgi:D-alanyl-D-alanine dipeptidase